MLIIICFLQGCKKSSYPLSKQGFYFDTLINISIYEGGDDSLLDESFQLCKKYEEILSKTIEGSDVYRINHSLEPVIKVSEDTINILKEAEYCSNLSEGRYDVTIEPLISLWNFEALSDHDKSFSIPSENSLREAMSHVSMSKLMIDEKNNTVTKTDPKCSIDLGSIAKGYIGDKLKEFLVERGVTSAIIDLGGNIILIGSKLSQGEGDRDFHIGIKNPDKKGNALVITAVNVRDTSVVTSGIYERFILINNKEYHHVIDPKTGYPVENELAAVTVICPSSTRADALSTCCLLLGEEKALKLIDSLEDTEAVFIKKDGSLSYTKAAASILEK